MLTLVDKMNKIYKIFCGEKLHFSLQTGKPALYFACVATLRLLGHKREQKVIPIAALIGISRHSEEGL